MDILTVEDFRKILAKLKDTAEKSKGYLIELDSVMGDGDLGLTMEAVFSAASAFAATSPAKDIGTLLMNAGMVMAKAAPSTMGTLMATGFMRGGKSLKGEETASVAQLRDFWKAFVEGIMDRGKSKPGEKTILDALYPAYESFEASAAGGVALKDACEKAKEAALRGVEATKDMVAQHGRAAYYQEKSRTLQDPGATVGSMIVAAISDYVGS
jgi:phosphoenolpyruvate---glycerone phosphotransferase subunit DhaL